MKKYIVEITVPDNITKELLTEDLFRLSYRVETIKRASPRWIVIANIPGKWTGVSYQFFDTEEEAQKCFNDNVCLGNTPTMRPFYEPSDKQFLHMLEK